MYNLTKLDLLWKWVDELKKTVADNVKHLLPDTSTATTGQILKLTGETKTPSWADEYSYTPPAYSETETVTGQKWIDGREIYTKAIIASVPTITEASDIVIDTNQNITILFSSSNINTTSISSIYLMNRFYIGYNSSNGNLYFSNIPASYSEKDYIVIYSYVKDPTPGRAPEDSDQEPEAEEKKTTRKKVAR